jgi:putative transposase
VQSEKYFLVCCRYIELNPVRASMAGVPEEYQWSSYTSNAWGDDSWITRHAEYERLGETRDKQCHSYRELFKGHIEVRDMHLIRLATHYCQPVGDDRFRHEIEKRYNIKIGQAKRGRPKKTKVGLVKL